MSGITPILDTLLHDVLGKRVDTQAPRQLNEPVQPVNPADAARAIHSDSRLDSRRPLFPELTPRPARDRAPFPLEPAPARTQTADAGTRASLSRGAQVIAELLQRFPGPPSVLRSTAPLMSTVGSSAADVAASLQSAVRDSGLFYESHLMRWYRGELSREQLQREPQMQQTLQLRLALQQSLPGQAERGAGAPATAEPRANTPSLAPSGVASQPPQPAKPAAEAAPATQGSPPQGGESAGSRLPTMLAALEQSPALQSLVQHQLELLAAPVLRWEGDVWSGIFMALMIHIPEIPQRHSEPRPEGEDADTEPREQDYYSELSLLTTRLGRLQISLSVKSDQLQLGLQTESADTLNTLQSRRDELLHRLQRCGFATVDLHMRQSGGPADE